MHNSAKLYCDFAHIGVVYIQGHEYLVQPGNAYGNILVQNDEERGETMKKVTIKEIANEMGLSRNTVAKALTNSDVVSYNTRRAVLEKANELGYQKLPANASRIINQGNAQAAKTILVLAYTDISVFWNEIILGISEELKNNGYKLRFNFISKEDEAAMALPLDWEDEAVGVLLLSVFSEGFVKKIKEKNLPMVFLDCPTDSSRFTKYGDVLVCEGKDSMKKIVDQLISQGIRDFSYLGDITYCKSVRERYEGFLAALEQAGIKVEESKLMTKHVTYRYYEKPEVEKALASLDKLPQAIVCANDDVAQFTIRYLKNRNIRVPEDVAVTGYDNLESLTHVEAFITTVNVENQKLGRRLVQQMIFRLKYPEFKPEVIHVGTDVIFRESSNKMVH